MTRHDEIRGQLAALNGQISSLSDELQELTRKPALDASITAWVETRALADELKTTKATLDLIITHLTDNEIPNQLAMHGLTSAHHALGQVKLTHHTKASIIKERKLDAYSWLRANELGSIIIETVNAQTLSAAAKELVANGSELPSHSFTTTFRQYANFTPKG